MSDTAKSIAEKEKAELEAYFSRMEFATAPAWRPSPGETIMGTVVGFGKGVPSDPNLKSYNIVYVNSPKDGCVIALHCFHQLHNQGFKDIAVKVGMRIADTYIGLKVKNDAVDKDEKDLEKTDTYHHYFVANLDNIQPAEEGTTFDMS